MAIVQATVQSLQALPTLLSEAERDGHLVSGVLIVRLPTGATINTINDEPMGTRPLPREMSTYSVTQLDDCFHIDRHRIRGKRALESLGGPTAESTADLDLDGFLKVLGEEVMMQRVRYEVDIEATTVRRQCLEIGRAPIRNLKGDSLNQARPSIPGIHTPYIYVSGSQPGSPFVLHAEDWGLYSLNFLHKGARKHWVVVSPSDRLKLEGNLIPYFSRRFGVNWTRPRCSQFVRHMALWLPPAMLDRWGVQYVMVEQEPGDLVITLPGAYHQGWNAGWNVAEAINYGGKVAPNTATVYNPCFRGCWPDPAERDPELEALQPQPSTGIMPVVLNWDNSSGKECTSAGSASSS